ncbi:MAG: hypothetical protein EAY75_16075 [Bacteroidetes bacterium]|nr:MAG: hypothetical protein EAY75_16075 [Bacteroidota bacterium]
MPGARLPPAQPCTAAQGLRDVEGRPCPAPKGGWQGRAAAGLPCCGGTPQQPEQRPSPALLPTAPTCYTSYLAQNRPANGLKNLWPVYATA